MVIVLAGSLFSSVLIAWASPYIDITVGTAYSMITGGAYPDLVILDVRTKSEYDSGHIYNAMLIPVADLPTRVGELASHKNDEIIVYCLSGGRSPIASSILDSNGFTKVYNMLEGITDWKSAGYPTWIATVHNLNTTFNYDTIQAAIESALTMDGNTIFVDNGIYHEHVVVGKPLSIVGTHLEGTVIDGNGTGTTMSITADNVTVENFTIRNGSESGMHLDGGNHAKIQNNKIISNYCGMNISSSYNMIFHNELTGNQYCGLSIMAGSSTIFENNITSSNYGICLNSWEVSNNLIYHNNFISNTQVFYPSPPSANFWDNGYPSGGNYWGDHAGMDLYWGSYQNKTGSDGIGDTPYVINDNNRDNYPLMSPYEYWRNPILGDINRDMEVDSEDLAQVAAAYGSSIQSSDWNPNCDIDDNDKVEILDLFSLGKNYGETVQTTGANTVEKISSMTTLQLFILFSVLGLREHGRIFWILNYLRNELITCRFKRGLPTPF